MKAIIIAIGDELLIGQVLDTNSQWISQQCNDLNIEVIGHRTIPDGVASTTDAIDRAFRQCDLVILTGGLGPTNDDYTARALAAYYGMEIVFHQATWDRLTEYFASRGRQITDALKPQAMLPEGVTFLENDMGTAPGMYHCREGKHLVSFPGVPHEMKHLFSRRFVPLIRPFLGKTRLIQRTVLTVGLGETDIAGRIADIESALPKELSLAYLPDIGKVRLRVSGRGEDVENLGSIVNQVADDIIERLGSAVYGEGEISLAEAVKELMVNKRLTLGLAESCTGGNISREIVSVPGASGYFKGSIVSYANEIKHLILSVSSESLNNYGAVSEEVAREMADGALRILNTDMAVSVTGIAGPDGGSESKPVGTFWVGIAMKGRHTETYQINFNRDRERNIRFVTVYVLNKIRLLVNEF